ncbi:protein Shroom2-like isoform X3 [Girardinichthys multiradiatus]|uniref:protein Shroom2-like isoform X3 n=1 Tax=Girardinichthys multiradiatus TaxID=208333 RepID=UPI001FADE400|nr:protein Shroom2-like isoform X3 [Girardinichthys multiradiatus]
MDAVRYADNLRLSAGRMKWDRWRRAGMDRKEDDEELVEVLLEGSAPWGFTLRGGTEHREPLIITKVEQGSMAATGRLRAGDEMVSVNATPLSGSRQEAICLVKGSQKTLTLVVRRKNDPGLRPHSWHSSKLTEEESEPAGSRATPAPVWQPKHEARESTSPGNQKNQQTNQLSSVNSMEKLERPSHPYPPGCLSPPKYIDSSEPFSGSGAKRDSAFSCFSGSSSPPVLDSSMSGRKGTSTENIFFKGLQSEGPQQNERHRYLQSTLGNEGWEGSRVEEQPTSRVSVAGRPSVGPVWQVPEKKISQSPPPPPPPLRSDSFAATKVFPYSEGPLGPPKSHGSSFEKLTENNQNCLRFQNQLHPNKPFSLSNCDVSQSFYAQSAAHQRQYSDESPFFQQTRAAPPTKTQSVGSYYRSLQDLPTNAFSRKHIRHSTAAITGCSANSSLENGGHNRHFGPAGKHPMQTSELKASKAGGWRGETKKSQCMTSSESGLQSSLKANNKAKYPTPQPQMPYSENKDRNGNGLNYDHKTYELSLQSTEEASKRAEGPHNEMKRLYITHQSNDHKVGLSRHQDPWVPQEDHRISALKTPLLHFLAQESQTLTERQPTAATKSVISTQDVCNTTTTSIGKACRRSDRYATTLRKEIQQKRAQLQKSRSAATLTYEAEEEDAEEWKFMEASASSNTYKDHLKEAQARVLQATSFQRRDLEPLGPEAPVLKASYGRIRGRKRFHPAKRTHSFSEPDKIDKVGVDGESQRSSEQQRKLFEIKPAFPRPVLKSSHGTNLNPDQDQRSKPQETLSSRESDQSQPSTDPDEQSPGHKQVLLEQQRLGTFAEYQATWNKQKKSSDTKTQGRFHSAENILDPSAEEKALCIHERSRSSPSADVYTQNIPSDWRDPQGQESSLTTRETAGSRSPDHSPQLVPSVPRNEGIFPGPPDHRTRPDPASPSHASLSSGRCSTSPNSECKPPQTQSLLPPPRLHLGPETTSSSQEFHAGAQPDPARLQPQSGSASDIQHHAAEHPSSAGPTQTISPHLSEQSGLGSAETKGEHSTAPPSSPSPSPSAALSLTGTDRARSPSPQFAPLRLTDKPPAVSVQDDLQLSSLAELQIPAVMDVSSPVRKVPVRIIHTESSSDRQVQAYLPQSNESCTVPKPSTNLSSLTAERTDSSLFSAYTRQDPQEPAPDPVSSQESGGARNLEEDAKREELVRDIMGRDKSLVDILDQSGRKTTMDLMEGLFPPEEKILEEVQLRRRASLGSRLPTTSRREEEDVSVSASASLVPSSSYYNTSAPKAELLIKMKDMQEELEDQDSEDELDVDLASKKQELISSLARKLEVLREARQSLQEDVEDNEALGREVEVTVQRLCQPNQLDKFRMFVGDLDKVVSLLLSLSGRLARVENALNSLEDEAPPEEKRTLTEKRKLLMRQHDDAKELKENLDRRERLVSGIMGAHLDAESLDDYRHFVKMKSALIIEQRKLEDKIKLGEEQLKCLIESLPLDQRPPLGL